MLVPHKNPPDNSRFAYTAAKYNLPFDLEAIAEKIGYPLFMKPYDGGQWVGVSHIKDPAALKRAYDTSGQRLMHLQAAVDGFDVFARSLSIGAETMVMKFRPDLPMHDRYAVEHEFLNPETGDEVLTISRLINAFFRWEFNSCETLIKGTEAYPIDYANASPDVAITSLHHYFPWAMKALLRWCVFCVVTGRRGQVDLDTRHYFDIGDREDLIVRGEARRATASSPTSTSRSSATRTSATAASRTSTRWCPSGSTPRSSTTCSWRRCARRTPRTSTRGSSRTSAVLSLPDAAVLPQVERAALAARDADLARRADRPVRVLAEQRPGLRLRGLERLGTLEGHRAAPRLGARVVDHADDVLAGLRIAERDLLEVGRALARAADLDAVAQDASCRSR